MTKIFSYSFLLLTIALASCASNPRDDRPRDPNPRPEVRQVVPAPPFYANGYIFPQYRARQYAVDDWQAHRLPYAPGPGFHWVKVGTEYALIKDDNGAIAQLVLNPH